MSHPVAGRLPAPVAAPVDSGPPAVGVIEACRLIPLEEYRDHRGALAVVEVGKDIDFPINRVYYLYDTPVVQTRGGHAHRRLRQIIIAAEGAFDIELDDGFRRRTYRLDRPDRGLFVGPMVWRDLSHFAPGTVALVLASNPYDPADYYRDYDPFLRDARALANPEPAAEPPPRPIEEPDDHPRVGLPGRV